MITVYVRCCHERLFIFVPMIVTKPILPLNSELLNCC